MNSAGPTAPSTVALIAFVAITLTAGAIVGWMVARRDGVPAVSAVGFVDMGESGGTLEADGRSYAVPWDIAWKGSDGFWREAGSGRPECLVAGGSRLRIVFWAVQGPIGLQVVAVDCSQARQSP